jgi:hypothetical protein
VRDLDLSDLDDFLGICVYLRGKIDKRKTFRLYALPGNTPRFSLPISTLIPSGPAE